MSERISRGARYSKHIVSFVGQKLPDYIALVDEPENRVSGRWLVDINPLDPKRDRFVVEWMQGRDFGVSRINREPERSSPMDGFGSKPDQIVKSLSQVKRYILQQAE